MRRALMATSFAVTAERVRGQGRPRFGRRGTYKASEDRAWERSIRDAFLAQGGGDMARFADEVAVRVRVRRRLPKDAPKRLLEQPDTCKPDLDNICKSVLDALNGVAFRDDAQVTRIHAEKMPRTHRENEVLEVTVEYFAEVNER